MPKIYNGVVNDVISSCKDAFQDEGYDEQTLTDLRKIWSRKLNESGVFNAAPAPRPQVRQVQYSNARPGYRPGGGQPVQLIYPSQQGGGGQQQRIIVQNQAPGQRMVLQRVVGQGQPQTIQRVVSQGQPQIIQRVVSQQGQPQIIQRAGGQQPQVIQRAVSQQPQQQVQIFSSYCHIYCQI